MTFFNKEKTEEEKRWRREAEYYKMIDKAACKKENFDIACMVAEHLMKVLKTIFKYAKSEVCIFTDRFDEAVSNDGDGLIMEVVRFLNKHETKLKIAYKTPNKDDILNGKFLKSILNASTKGKVEIWDASKVATVNNSYLWFNDNYSFVDGPQNPKVNFGNKEVGKFIANLFIEIIIRSKKILS